MKNVLVALFPDSSKTQSAIENLRQNGYGSDTISVIMRDSYMVNSNESETNVVGKAAEGATAGGLIGALAGLLIGVGAVTIPGLGALLIGGPIAAALGLTGVAATTASGAITGTLAGGLAGALLRLGFSESQAKAYTEKITEGASLLMVSAPDNQLDEAESILKRSGAGEVNRVQMPD
jgi:uncharacterized membrane protein